MWKFPWVRPRPTPKVGQSFSLQHLQSLARKSFERLSELTGISTRRLLPIRLHLSVLGGKARGNLGLYHPKYHGVYRPSLRSWKSFPSVHIPELLAYLEEGPRTSTVQHEHIHAITSLLGRGRQSSENLFLEERFARLGTTPILVSNAERRMHAAINQAYRLYGTDGFLAVILLRRAINNPSDIKRVQHSLVSRGYLSRNGFTSKGAAWFKRIAARRIEKKLTEVELARQAYNRKLLPFEKTI